MLSIRTILHPTDFSSQAEAALQHAQHLARALKAELHLLHAIPAPGTSAIIELPRAGDHPGASYLQEATARALHAVLAPIEIGDDRLVRYFMSQGASPSRAILEHMRTHAIDLIVLGTRGQRNRSRELLGSVALDVMRRASCTVLFVHGPDEKSPDAEPLRRLLVYLDAESGTGELLHHAHDLAALYRADVDVVYVTAILPSGSGRGTRPAKQSPEPARSPVQREALRGTASFTPCVLEHHRRGYPPEIVARFARTHPPDLLVMAAPRLAGVSYAPAETLAERVVSRAPCPVLTFDYSTCLATRAPKVVRSAVHS